MNKQATVVSLALVALLAAAPAHSAPKNQPGAKQPAKKLFCWNENGRRVCGDALPASAVDSARTEISAKSGLPTGQVARALTVEERAQAQQAADAARQAEFEAAAQRMREVAMAESYDTEHDLRRAFGERIALMDDTIKAAQMSIGSLRLSLLSLLRQAGEAELAGKPVAATLTSTIRSQHGELMRQQALLVQHRRNRGVIDADLAHALERYRQLKSPGTAATASTARDG